MRRSLLWLVTPFFLSFLLTWHVHSQVTQSNSGSTDSFDSPRLAALAREMKAGNQAALQQFWEEVKGKTPLVETIPENGQLRRVTFLWRGGDEARGIKLIGPLPFEMRGKPLARLENTDLWFVTLRLPATARFSYGFEESSKQQYGDPLNPRTRKVDSVAELPGASAQTWAQPQPNVPKGVLKEEKLKSAILQEERAISVYTPANYDAQRSSYGLLIVFDGEEYRSVVPTPVILDNLVARKKILPLVAILVNSGKARNRELGCSAPFVEFLATELVPWARQHYRLSTDPRQTIVCGSSLGGLSAAYCAFRHSEVFGNVLSQSGAFWYYPGYNRDETESSPFGWLTRQFETTPKLPIQFYLEAGLFETGRLLNILAENRRLRDVLQAKGYSVVYTEFAGGHEYMNWRGSLADGLIALAGREK